MTPGLGTPGRPPWELVIWRPGAPVVLSPRKPGLPVEPVWLCSPGKPLVGAVPEEQYEEKETETKTDVDKGKCFCFHLIT